MTVNVQQQQTILRRDVYKRQVPDFVNKFTAGKNADAGASSAPDVDEAIHNVASEEKTF